jgi:TATA-binding protein-associated factor Taf7
VYAHCCLIDESCAVCSPGRLQKATRQLQSLALYGKRNRDKMLSLEGPKLKRVLEQLIYRMKDMAQDCVGAGAVYVGNLKSRDITGKEIVEEESESESESESEDEDESEDESGSERGEEEDEVEVEDKGTLAFAVYLVLRESSCVFLTC